MTRTPAELFAEIAKADLERREPMMRARDYEDVEATEAEIRSMGGGFAILCGLLLGLATVMVLAVVKAWPVISAAVRGLL